MAAGDVTRPDRPRAIRGNPRPHEERRPTLRNTASALLAPAGVEETALIERLETAPRLGDQIAVRQRVR